MSPLKIPMPLLSSDEARSLIKLAKSLCATQSPEPVFVALQRLLEDQDRPQIADFFKRIKKMSPSQRQILERSFSTGQVESKIWLISELKAHIGPSHQTVIIAAGWTALFATLLNWIHPTHTYQILSVDRDPEATVMAGQLNKWFELNSKNFFAIQKDIFEFPYHEFNALVVINTSCEHLTDLGSWVKSLPPHTVLVLQSNNAFSYPDHIACVSSAQELAEKAGLQEILFQGELKLSDYSRFMIIGKT